jgi:glycosyltransferase involved in cell wall biosynthesis
VGSINIVVPPLQRHAFTGGILCIFEYAKGLTARGHRVNILPLLPSPTPLWPNGDFGRIVTRAGAARSVGPRPVRRGKELVLDCVRNGIARASMRTARLFPYELQRGLHLRHVRQLMCEADVTLATSFETALPVHLYGTGQLRYFVQHFEPYFAQDLPDARWAEHEALCSYGLGLGMIANSGWLSARLAEHVGTAPPVCNNAVDHRVFHGEVKRPHASAEVRVISYGGRQASWKGFREMAEAVRAVRRASPSRNIRWLVYGDSLLRPRNDIASYEPLGFLRPAALAQAYRSADILLSASWYESFPLFPLEAMACGLAVVTTQPGAEEFATHGATAEIVEPRNVASIARGLQRVIDDPDYRAALATNGRTEAQRFSWQRSVDRRESLLFAGAGA